MQHMQSFQTCGQKAWSAMYTVTADLLQYLRLQLPCAALHSCTTGNTAGCVSEHSPSTPPFLPVGIGCELPNCVPAVLCPRAASGAIPGEALLGLAGLGGGGGLGAWDWGKEAAAPCLARPLASLEARGLGVGFCGAKRSRLVTVGGMCIRHKESR